MFAALSTTQNSLSIRNVILLVCALVILAAVFLFVRMPSNTPFWNEFENAGHAPLFGCVTLIMLGLLRQFRTEGSSPRLSTFVWALILASTIGALSEILQYFIGRDAELRDWAADTAGALAFLTIWWSVKHAPLTHTARLRTYSIRIAALILLMIPAIPALIWGTVILHRNAIYPRLGAFDSRLERKLFETRDATLDAVPAPLAWTGKSGIKVGRVTFAKATYPSLLCTYVYPKWDGFKSLSFDVFSDRDTTVNLAFRIYDAGSSGCYPDRFNAIFKLTPGGHHIDIPLDTIRLTPSGRTMHLDHTAGLIAFLIDPADTLSLYFDDFRLN
jgi:VanZ family protein